MDEDIDEEYWDKEAAIGAYRDMKPPVYEPVRYEPISGRPCENCSRGGGRHSRTDSSGITGLVCDGCSRDSSVELSFG